MNKEWKRNIGAQPLLDQPAMRQRGAVEALQNLKVCKWSSHESASGSFLAALDEAGSWYASLGAVLIGESEAGAGAGGGSSTPRNIFFWIYLFSENFGNFSTLAPSKLYTNMALLLIRGMFGRPSHLSPRYCSAQVGLIGGARAVRPVFRHQLREDTLEL